MVLTGNGSKDVRALPWEQARQISKRFAALNPYNREAIPGSVLKIEDDNFDPKTGKQRQLYCVAISAKRYALFLRNDHGEPVLLRASCPFCGRKNKATAKICADPNCGDPYTGKRYSITTEGHHGDRYTARVKTYGDVLREYEFHAESKCADTTGKTSGKQTIGLLQRRHIRIDQIKYIGKESNMLEEVEEGLIHSAKNVYTEYPERIASTHV